MTLPLPLRNRLAELILDGFHDPEARKGLAAMAAVCAKAAAPGEVWALPARFPEDLFERRDGALYLKRGCKQHVAEAAERSERALRIVGGRPLDPREAPLATALAQAAVLFDARLFFEVHELLEPYWMRSEGSDREALQGLIQVAAGLHHLGNGNVSGARSLLHDGIAKLFGRALAGCALGPFASALIGCLDEVVRLGGEPPAQFDWKAVPRFPWPVHE
jgi:hypothetical protein